MQKNGYFFPDHLLTPEELAQKRAYEEVLKLDKGYTKEADDEMKDIERKVEEIRKARKEMSFKDARKKEAEILRSLNFKVRDDYFTDKFDEF